jgi:glycosyltransferase involved in cell wall biosynthesis
MKPKILHLIGDKRAGGSNLLVKQLITSHLSEKFDFDMLRLEEARLQLKNIRPDLIIFHYPCAWKYLLDLVFLKRYSQVFICDHHYCEGFEREQVSSPVRFRLMLRLAYGLADGVISISQAQRQWMLDCSPRNGRANRQLVNPNKVIVINPASKIEEILTIEPKNPSQPLQIGAYGRFAKQKGFDVLLEAIALLSPEKFQLHLCGYGPDEAIIQQLSNKLPQVQLFGPSKDISKFLSLCDVVVIPSRWEPWGLVGLEAKAAGKPIIASAVDGLCEQVQSCGILVPPNDPQKLAEAIASLPDRDLAAWGKAGRDSVVNAWDEFLDRWDKFLGEVTL